MLYAILCYDSEAVVGSWTQEEDDAVIARLMVPQEKLAAKGKLGPVVRLMPTTTAATFRAGAEPMVTDGPFAETKEQLLGFYVVDCESLEEATETARLLEHGTGSLEVRPIRLFNPGHGFNPVK